MSAQHTPMSLGEARAILYAADASDPVRAIEAVATVLRFNAISEPKLMAVACTLEQIADEIDKATGQADQGSDTK